MHPYIKAAVAEALRSVTLGKTVDLGSGTGDGGELLRPHTRYLVGVDCDPDAVKVAEERGFYDELHVADVRNYPLDNVDSVALFDSLEHLTKKEGHVLLERCGARYVMLTTPWWSVIPGFISNPEHKCLWSEEELGRLGFETAAYSFMPDIPMFIAYGGIILGSRDSLR